MILYAVNNDYPPLNVRLNFPSGSAPGTQRCFNVPVIDDFLVELTEFFQLAASSPDPSATFTPGRDTARVDIIDNDRELVYYHSICSEHL